MRDPHYDRMCFKSAKTLGALHSHLYEENNVLVCFKNFERPSTSHKSLHSLTRAVSVLWTNCRDSRKLFKCSLTKAVTLPPDMGNPHPILGKGCPTTITRAVMQQAVCQTCLIIKRANNPCNPVGW